ncbi:hypothetical protein CASFOL_026924 [Castilleja foliolosa]|uniref:Diacylglycerol kinase accessory domain-containing protein n=1 Tax=Castilleja foliolosa TaxID=1961234 RepID=A0ABD3CM78_9LAMI
MRGYLNFRIALPGKVCFSWRQLCKRVSPKTSNCVEGGDGTVGWGSLGELTNRTGCLFHQLDLFHLVHEMTCRGVLGGSFPFNWKTTIKTTLDKITTGLVVHLDRLACFDINARSWTYLILSGQQKKLLLISRMDAQVAYGFHNLRNEKPYLAQGPIANKLIYSGYSCKQGWFFTPCSSDPGLRSLKSILRIYAKKVNSSQWEQVPVPSSVRSVVALNLPSYGSGRNPWGNLKPDYLEKGFVEVQADDGLLEVFGFKQGWHASMVMVELISAKHITQASAIRFELRGGEWTEAYTQMDGEPWKQPMNKEFSTFIEIKCVPHHSLVVRGD